MGGLFCCGLPVAAVAVWTAFLYAGVALANQLVSALTDPRPPDDDWDADPLPEPVAPARTVPVPSLGVAVAAVTLTGLVNAAVMFGVGWAWGGPDLTIPLLATSPVLYLIASAVLAGLIGTSLPRAALIVLFQWLIAAAAAGVLRAVWVARGW